MSSNYPGHVAILGGGLTGLSAAFHLARRSPQTKITLYECTARLGGWVRSDRVTVADTDGTNNQASILLEAAPRTLRPGAMPVLELVHLLDLGPRLLTTPRSSPAAKARFLCLDDQDGLSILPSSLFSLFATSLGRFVLRAVVREIFTPANSPADQDQDGSEDAATQYDESVDAFFARRFGAEFARVFASALVHGIYATDARQLSVRAAFPILYDLERRGRGSVVWGAIGPRAWFSAGKRARETREKEERGGWEVGDVERRVKGAALLSFDEGMGTLVGALEDALGHMPNVEVLRGVGVQRVDLDGDTITIYTSAEDQPSYPTHIISALPLPTLHTLLPAQLALPHLNANTARSVAVLNLVFPASRLRRPLHQPGFGFLIPRPRGGYPASEQGEKGVGGASAAAAVGMLGVVFDSSSLGAQDHLTAPGARGHPPPFVKMTAMIGGPFGLPAEAEAGDEKALTDAVLGRLAVQLGFASKQGNSRKDADDAEKGPLLEKEDATTMPAPVLTRLHVHHDAIPTLGVGHVARMDAMKEACDRVWKGRLIVVGAGVGGPAVAECVRGGRDAARRVCGEI